MQVTDCIPTLLSYRQQPTESSLTFSFLFNVYLNYAAKVHKFSKIEPILIQYDRLLYLYFLFFYLLLPSENIYKLNFYHESFYEDRNTPDGHVDLRTERMQKSVRQQRHF